MAWRYHALDDLLYERRVLVFGGPIIASITAAASALGNRRRRQEAERAAAPQWRSLGPVVVEVEADRLVVSRNGERGTVWLASVVELRVDEQQAVVDLFFERDVPYRFQGPDVACLAEALAAMPPAPA